MLTLADYTKAKPKGGDLGIEVEVEFQPGTERPTEIGGVWLAKDDPSLKYGAEYVTRQPIKCDNKKYARITTLTDVLQKAGTVVHNAPRTSVHVHMNMLNHTPVQIWNSALLLWIFENLLYKVCHPLRRGNLFCLGVQHAEGIVRDAIREVSRRDGGCPFTTFTEDSHKYSSQNLATLRSYGSLENRMMSGTIDPTLIDDWSTTLHTIVTKAKNFSSPDVIMDFLLESKKDAFIGAFIPPSMVTRLTSYPDWRSLLNKNNEALAEFAYYHDDWLKWQQEWEERYLNKQGKIKTATAMYGDDVFNPFIVASTVGVSAGSVNVSPIVHATSNLHYPTQIDWTIYDE